jgi:signal transduction histidine kinase
MPLEISKNLSEEDRNFIEHSYRRQIILYNFAFAILSFLLLGNYFLQRHIVQQQQNFAKIINLSGRQRLHSQKIVELAQHFINTPQEKDLKLLHNALDSFIHHQSLFMLSKDHPDSLADLNNAQTDKIYKDNMSDNLLLITETKLFLERAEVKNLSLKMRILQLSEYSEKMAQLGLGTITAANDALTFARVNQANIFLDDVKRNQFIFFIITYVVLIFEAFFLFIPEAKKRKKATARILHYLQREKEMQKFSVLGEVSAKIVHEINNPLTAVIGRVDILLRNKDKDFDEKTIKTFEGMKQNLGRISKIIRLTKIVYRKGNNDNINVFDLKTIIFDIIETTYLLQGKENLNFESKLEDGLFIKAQDHQIFQVINNIVGNAIEATVNLNERKISIHLFANNKIAILRISDNGDGVPAEIQNNIFKKLFTTKKAGTGIGLYESKEIVESYGGSIRLAIEISNNCFEISFPLE